MGIYLPDTSLITTFLAIQRIKQCSCYKFFDNIVNPVTISMNSRPTVLFSDRRCNSHAREEGLNNGVEQLHVPISTFHQALPGGMWICAHEIV